MNALITALLSRSRTVLLLFFLLVASGIFSLNSIPKESFPDVTIPMAYVSVSLEGISPNDADSMLVSPLEKELKGMGYIYQKLFAGEHKTYRLEVKQHAYTIWLWVIGFRGGEGEV